MEAKHTGDANVERAALRQGPFLLGLLLVTASLLSLEVLDTRLLSVLTWYSLAFLVIAMGMFGLTAGAVHVYLKGANYSAASLPKVLSEATRWLAWSIPISYVLLLLVPLRVEPVATTLVLFVVFSAIIALPFYPAGIVVAAALTRSPFPIGRVYAIDLLGAALGAPLAPLLLRLSDGGTAILSLSVLTAISSVCFAWSGAERTALRRGAQVAIALAAFTALNGSSERGLVPLWVKGLAENREKVVDERWNSYSRVQVLRDVVSPAVFWGKGQLCPAPIVHQRDVFIDGHAATPIYLHDLEYLRRLDFLSCDVTNAVHALRPHGSIAIIGVGGSRDLQSALLAGHRPVLGIELNDVLLDVLRGPYGAATGIAGRPDVKLVHDEARSYLARHDQRYQVIQASLIDTWAATGAGAHALSENGLYTLEAFELFLDRLQPGGILSVSRWASIETARLVALGVGALIERGVDRPREHIALLAAGPVSTLLLARDPLSSDDEQRITDLARSKGFAVIATPTRHSTAERLERALDATNLEQLERTALLPLLDLRPPTDDRPFFFNAIRLQALWHVLPPVTRGAIEGNLLATRALGLAFFASMVLVVFGIALPLGRRARPQGRVDAKLYAALAYFAAIGVGFMLVEIALLQRLSLVLGHPSYSLMVVLSSLIGAAGLGSLASDRLPVDRSPGCYLFPALLAAVVAAIGAGWPALSGGMMAAPTLTRVAFAVAISAVTGFALGFAFPAGMRLVRAAHDQEMPWLWGINGMGSVLASSLALLIALEWGLTRLLLVAAVAYMTLIPAIVVLRRAAGRAAAKQGESSLSSTLEA